MKHKDIIQSVEAFNSLETICKQAYKPICDILDPVTKISKIMDRQAMAFEKSCRLANPMYDIVTKVILPIKKFEEIVFKLSIPCIPEETKSIIDELRDFDREIEVIPIAVPVNVIPPQQQEIITPADYNMLSLFVQVMMLILTLIIVIFTLQ